MNATETSKQRQARIKRLQAQWRQLAKAVGPARKLSEAEQVRLYNRAMNGRTL